MFYCYRPSPLYLGLTSIPTASAQSTFSLPLTTGSGNKLDLGFFAAGTTYHITMTGNGDVVDSCYQVKPDGSLYAPSSGTYSFANNGAAYSQAYGGDGVNHFVGGGANYDSSGSGFPFAGKQTTDTTDPADIRAGAVVGTWSASPTRSDWSLVGNGGFFSASTGGANLYLAVNDTVNGDNHGEYAGQLAAAPEPSQFAAFAVGLLGLGALALKARKRVTA